MTSITLDTNRRLGSQFFESQDRSRGGPDPALCTPGYTAELGGNPAMPLAGHAGFGAAFYAGFPDARHHIEEVIATDDRVVVRFVFHGTQTGSLFGIPPTGKSVRVAAHAILDVENGRVARNRAVYDEAGMLRQIGVLPG